MRIKKQPSDMSKHQLMELTQTGWRKRHTVVRPYLDDITTYPEGFTDWDKAQLDKAIKTKAPIIVVPIDDERIFHEGHKISPTSLCMTPMPLKFERQACFCGRYIFVREAAE